MARYTLAGATFKTGASAQALSTMADVKSVKITLETESEKLYTLATVPGGEVLTTTPKATIVIDALCVSGAAPLNVGAAIGAFEFAVPSGGMKITGSAKVVKVDVDADAEQGASPQAVTYTLESLDHAVDKTT